MGSPNGFTDTLYSQALEKMVVLLNRLTSLDRTVRIARSQQAPRAAAGAFQQVTSALAQRLAKIDQTGQDHVYAGVLITFDGTSGAGKYWAHGETPTTTSGLDIPAGFFELWIEGIDNLRNFQMIATTATDLRASLQYFD